MFILLAPSKESIEVLEIQIISTVTHFLAFFYARTSLVSEPINTSALFRSSPDLYFL